MRRLASSLVLLLLITPAWAQSAKDVSPTRLVVSDFDGDSVSTFNTRDADCDKGAFVIWVSIFVEPETTPCADERGIYLTNSEVARTGKTTSARVKWTVDEDIGLLTVELTSRKDHIFIRFYVYFDTSYDHASGEKNLRFGDWNSVSESFDYQSIGQFKRSGADGTSDDLAEVTVSSNGGFGSYAGCDWTTVQTADQTRQTWHFVEYEIKLNAPGSSDGEIRIYWNGVEKQECTGLDIRGAHTDDVNYIQFGGWYSNGGSNPDPSATRYIDALEVATQYIGEDETLRGQAPRFTRLAP